MNQSSRATVRPALRVAGLSISIGMLGVIGVVVVSLLYGVTDYVYFGTWSYTALGFVAGAFMLPAAFVSTIATWGYVRPDEPRTGAFTGILAAAVTYAVGIGLFQLVLTINNLARGHPDPFLGALGMTIVVGVAAVVRTIWIAVPMGALFGYLFERYRPPS